MFSWAPFALCLLLPLAVTAQDECLPIPCGEDEAMGMCSSKTVLYGGEPVKCCRVTGVGKDVVTCGILKSELDKLQGKRSSASVQSQVNDYARQSVPERPTKAPREQAKQAARSLQGASADVGKANLDEQTVNQRSGLFNFGLLGGLFGGAPIYPECPVHVKMCYRVPCGGYNNPALESNPRLCLSDPRCCYDYRLGFMRSIFGPKFFGGAPACYFGPTSKQWVYVTNFFKPWNPWYTDFVLEVFEEIFNTNAFDIGGRFLCEIDFQRKNYPVGAKSKLQCNLVSGCWDEDMPEGSQCLMASDLIQQFFGQTTVYPSLFTNDPADTQCSANWFDFGPKAYQRLPCGVGPPPEGFFDKLYRWCPYTDCCLNYAAGDLGLDPFTLSLLGGVGGGSPFPGVGGGSPFPGIGGVPSFPGIPGFGGAPGFGTTPFNPSILQYLIGGGGSSDLTDLFCPYKLYFSSSLFPDFEDDIEGCCDIPLCYHKKKLVGGVPPPRPPTRPPLPPPVSAQWGEWSVCDAPCGQLGTQRRTCYVGGQPSQPNFCQGPDTQQCQGNPCPVQYRWSNWGSCNAPCDQTGTQRRTCLYQGQVVQSNFCQGRDTRPCQGNPCPVQYTWGQWRLWGPCSVTCGTGSGTYRRGCFGRGQQVDPSLCGGGAATKTDSCQAGPCPTPPPQRYTWSGMMMIQQCSVTCGRGFEVWGRKCQDQFGRTVPDRFCPGSPQRQNRVCVRAPCPRLATWTDWRPASECGATCGPRGLRWETRTCSYADGSSAQESECRDDGQGTSRVAQCGAPVCPDDPYYWTGWSPDCRVVNSQYCFSNQFVRQYQECYELRNGVYVRVVPQSRCGPRRERNVPCTPDALRPCV